MNRLADRRKLRLSGFSLIELVIVVVIIGILAAIAVPRLAGTSSRAIDALAHDLERTLQNGAAAYIGDRGEPPSGFRSWVGLSTSASTRNTVFIPTTIRQHLQDHDADILADGSTLDLKFKNGLHAVYKIDPDGNVTATFTRK